MDQTEASFVTLKELIKSAMVEALRPEVSNRLHGFSDRVEASVRSAVEAVAEKVLDETKIEEIANSAREGATYTAVTYELQRAATDALREMQPALDLLKRALDEATWEAINELLLERLKEMIHPTP